MTGLASRKIASSQDFRKTTEANLSYTETISLGKMSLLDRPTAMTSWEKDAVQDLDSVYQSKTIPDRGDIDTVWKSMYEKGLGRKVSQYSLPPQAANELADPENPSQADSPSQDKPVEQEEMGKSAEIKNKDLASVHLERAINLGKLPGKDEGRRWRKRTYSNSSEH